MKYQNKKPRLSYNYGAMADMETLSGLKIIRTVKQGESKDVHIIEYVIKGGDKKTVCELAAKFEEAVFIKINHPEPQ